MAGAKPEPSLSQPAFAVGHAAYGRGLQSTPGRPGPRSQYPHKPFRDALRMEVLAAGDDHKAPRRIARKLLEQAYTGDIAAIKEVADRLEGKVPQLIGGDDEAGPVCFARIERVIVQVEHQAKVIEHEAPEGLSVDVDG
jgi:hypothetical protein